MTLNCVKLGWAVTSMKYFAGIVSLFLPKSLIWNKTAFPAPNSLNFAELMENELMRISTKHLPIFLFLSNLSLLIVKILRAYS